jgi:hypothetical protein
MEQQVGLKVQEAFEAAFRKLNDIERRFGPNAVGSAAHGSARAPTAEAGPVSASMEAFEAAAEHLLDQIDPREYHRALDEITAVRNALVTVVSYLQGTYRFSWSYRLGATIRRFISGS